MDFTAPKPSFGDSAPQFGKLAQHRRPTYTAKEAGRRLVMFTKAEEVVRELPKEGETLYAVQHANLDLAVILMAVIDKVPNPCLSLTASTLCYHKRNALELLGALESGKIGRLTLLVSHFFASHYRPLHDWFCAELAAFPESKVGVARSHAKVAVLTFADGTALTCHGSGNLRSNKNVEQLAVTHDRGVAAFFEKWIESEVNHAPHDHDRG